MKSLKHGTNEDPQHSQVTTTTYHISSNIATKRDLTDDNLNKLDLRGNEGIAIDEQPNNKTKHENAMEKQQQRDFPFFLLLFFFLYSSKRTSQRIEKTNNEYHLSRDIETRRNLDNNN